MQTAIAEPVVNYARCSRRPPRRRRHQHPTKCPHFKYYAPLDEACLGLCMYVDEHPLEPGQY